MGCVLHVTVSLETVSGHLRLEHIGQSILPEAYFRQLKMTGKEAVMCLPQNLPSVTENHSACVSHLLPSYLLHTCPCHVVTLTKTVKGKKD